MEGRGVPPGKRAEEITLKYPNWWVAELEGHKTTMGPTP